MGRMLGVSVLALAIVPSLAFGQAKTREGLILFKDGFSLQGRIFEVKDIIFDPASGASFSVSAGGLCLYLDDGVRRVYFSHSQLHDVIPRTEKEINDQVVFMPEKSRKIPHLGIPPSWSLEDVTDWSPKWTRMMYWRTPKGGRVPVEQRVVLLTPYQMQVQTIDYRGDVAYLTRELKPELVRSLLTGFMSEQKIYRDRKPVDKLLDTARFLHQVGWYDLAEKDLQEIERTYFDQKERIAQLRETTRAVQANLLVDELDRAWKAGQHNKARQLIEQYLKDDLAGIVSNRHKLMATEIRGKYDGLAEKVEETRSALAAVADRTIDRTFWKPIVEEISAGVNEDTLHRLESFLQYAKQYRRDILEKKKPSQSAEEVLSLGVSGWLQGNFASEADPKLARQLWQTREMVHAFVKTDAPRERSKILNEVSKADEIHIDQLARMVQLLPPVRSPEKFSTDLESRDYTLGDYDGGSYLVQLPPEYHPHRSYPVVVLLHTPREEAKAMVSRVADLAAKYGFIIMAPLWAGKDAKGATYGYTAREHALVLDALRDLRQVYNVDCDRTFLFGWEAGGDMAYDIGLSHPHEFAGVVVMNGSPRAYAQRYWSNGQYLPFYVVEGERNLGGPKANRDQFKHWVSGHYPSIYVEYKGRVSEWYQSEVPTIFDWMHRKKRFHPLKQMGLSSPTGGSAEEFKSYRRSDNRYYWLSFEVNERNLNDHRSWRVGVEPGMVQANIQLGNELEFKAKEKGGTEVKGARVWTAVMIRARGVHKISLWLTPAMHDFKRPIQVRLNGDAVGPPRLVEPSMAVLLEDYALRGDRIRLPYARIDLP